MQTNKIDNTSFGQVNLIRVRKNAFKNPEKLHKCSMDFDKMISKVNGNKLGTTTLGFYLNLILYKLGKKAKISTGMLGWKGFMPIDKPIDADYHSFALFTGKDNEKIRTLLSKENKKAFSDKAKEEVKYETYKNDDGSLKDFNNGFKAYVNAYIQRSMELLSEQSQKIFAGSKVHEFKVDSLQELKNFKSKLGL